MKQCKWKDSEITALKAWKEIKKNCQRRILYIAKVNFKDEVK